MVESDAIDDLVREKIKSLDVECLWWRAGGARAGAPACEMSPQFYCRIGSRMRNLPTMSTIVTERFSAPSGLRERP